MFNTAVWTCCFCAVRLAMPRHAIPGLTHHPAASDVRHAAHIAWRTHFLRHALAPCISDTPPLRCPSPSAMPFLRTASFLRRMVSCHGSWRMLLHAYRWPVNLCARRRPPTRLRIVCLAPCFVRHCVDPPSLALHNAFAALFALLYRHQPQLAFAPRIVSSIALSLSLHKRMYILTARSTPWTRLRYTDFAPLRFITLSAFSPSLSRSSYLCSVFNPCLLTTWLLARCTSLRPWSARRLLGMLDSTTFGGC